MPHAVVTGLKPVLDLGGHVPPVITLHQHTTHFPRAQMSHILVDLIDDGVSVVRRGNLSDWILVSGLVVQLVVVVVPEVGFCALLNPLQLLLAEAVVVRKQLIVVLVLKVFQGGRVVPDLQLGHQGVAIGVIVLQRISITIGAVTPLFFV
jgi:hypothetical protein